MIILLLPNKEHVENINNDYYKDDDTESEYEDKLKHGTLINKNDDNENKDEEDIITNDYKESLLNKSKNKDNEDLDDYSKENKKTKTNKETTTSKLDNPDRKKVKKTSIGKQVNFSKNTHLVNTSNILSDDNYTFHLSTLNEVDDNLFSHLSVLFEGDFRISSYYIGIICLTSACIFYGPLLIQSITLLKLVETGVYSLTPKEIIISNLNVAFSLMFSNPIGGFIAEIKVLGRKYSILGCYLICLIASMVLLYDKTYYETCQTIILFSGNVGYNNFITYFTELYPTEMKDTSVSFFFFICRIGGFISQFIFLIFFSWNYNLPYYVLFVLLLITNYFVFFLPYDTTPNNGKDKNNKPKTKEDEIKMGLTEETKEDII